MTRLDLKDVYAVTDKGNLIELIPSVLDSVKQVGKVYFIRNKFGEEKIIKTGNNMFELGQEVVYKTMPIWFLRKLIERQSAFVHRSKLPRIDFTSLKEFNLSLVSVEASDDGVGYVVIVKKIVLEKGGVLDNAEIKEEESNDVH